MNLKKPKNSNKIIIMLMFNILLFIFYYGVNLEMTQVHEMAHKEIAENHGCVKNEINISMTGGGTFQCLKYMERPEKIIQQEAKLHSINEIVGYNISGIISSIIISITILMNVLFIRWVYD